MLSGSQEGIVLYPETLLPSSILAKKANKTLYIYLPSTEQSVFSKYFEDNLNFVLLKNETKKSHAYTANLPSMLHHKNTLNTRWLMY